MVHNLQLSLKKTSTLVMDCDTQNETDDITNIKKGKYSNTEQHEAGPSTSFHSKTREDPEKIEYEPVPSKRNRIARKLIQKMRHIIYEYSVKTGEQISGVFIEKPNASNRDYKIYGTKPLVSIMDNLKESIDEKFQKSTSHSITPDLKLPLLTIDGVVTKLEYFTQSQLRKFIPQMIKYSTGRHYTGWNNPALKPVWWPKDLAWFNVRYDLRSTEQKETEKWTNTLQRIIKECYKYYGCEDMLQGHEILSKNNFKATLPEIGQDASTSSSQHTEEMENVQPILIENVPTFHDFQIINESPAFEIAECSTHFDNNVMYLFQAVGPTANLLHPIQVVPVETINLEHMHSVSNTNEFDIANEIKHMEVENIKE